jgi:hypothetical protein
LESAWLLLIVAWVAVAAVMLYSYGGRPSLRGCATPLPGECTFDMLAFYYDDDGVLQCDCPDDLDDRDSLLVGS